MTESKAIKEPKPKAQRVKRICDPRLVSAARELRDRWMERINESPLVAQGKYEVSRSIGEEKPIACEARKLLAA